MNVTGLDGVLRKFNSFSKEIRKEVAAEIKFSADAIRKEAVSKAPADEGKLRNSISVKKIDEVNYEVVVQNQIAPFLEFGTKKRFDVDSEFAAYAAGFRGVKVANAGTLDDNILKWVTRKKIRFDSAGGTTKSGRQRKLTFEQTAFIISRFIAFNGIKPHPFLLPAFKQERQTLIARLKRLVNA